MLIDIVTVIWLVFFFITYYLHASPVWQLYLLQSLIKYGLLTMNKLGVTVRVLP